MSLFKQFQIAKDYITLQYGANADGSIPTFYVGRQAPSNMEWSRIVEAETRQYRRQIDMETLDKMVEREINFRIFAKALMPKPWEHVQDAAGKEIEFSVENAVQLFRALPELFYDLNRQSLTLALFRDEEQESAAKN